jgi:hypothetical protein
MHEQRNVFKDTLHTALIEEKQAVFFLIFVILIYTAEILNRVIQLSAVM